MNIRVISVAVLTLAMTGSALADTLTGKVSTSEGKALEGVMVRLSDERSGVSESVYSDAGGNYVLETDLSGKLSLRLRTPYYRDVTASIELPGAAQQDFVMQAMTGAAEISESLPAAYHFGNLPFDDGDDADFSRMQFQRDCLSCHQLGNHFSRQPRTPESW